ncbi:hypothetical protein DE146DRAFT_67684 [Phaeosphaeria sp. MPI-PUGE-AT-0046c]|nr:hypothetical protein DE146DRAFT_67684 [Phaeosphaeria sp. MPI-PUGE-AT-0046c]
MSALDEFIPFILSMMKNPADPNARPPLANRQETVYGVTMPFQILSLVAVGLRLHTRFRVVRDPGLDDVFIIAAAIFKLIGLIAFYGGFQAGIGKHLIEIFDNLEVTMVWFYVANVSYIMTAVFVKLSLLFQYLRLFHEGYRRIATIVLLTLVTLWGCAFAFMAWFPCFPVSGFWDKRRVPPAKCYGFGYRTLDEAKNTLFAFSGSNMILDVAIFLVPLTEFLKPGLNRKQALAMTGLFTFGSLVIMMAILRLWSGLKHNNTNTMYDFTFWLPEVLIFSCLEVDFAIISASMPIFWPSVMAAWTEIFVTQEISVVHDRRSRYIDVNELDMQLNRTDSHKSHDSSIALTQTMTGKNASFFTSFDPITGLGPGSGIAQVEVRTGAQPAQRMS